MQGTQENMVTDVIGEGGGRFRYDRVAKGPISITSNIHPHAEHISKH